jgi:hypothetical protein
MRDDRGDHSRTTTILAEGEPCQAVIAQAQALGMRNPGGDDMYAFALTIIASGRSPYQVQVGNPVPAAALGLLYPGSSVPAKRMPQGDDRELAIDWESALVQVTQQYTNSTHHSRQGAST